MVNLKRTIVFIYDKLLVYLICFCLRIILKVLEDVDLYDEYYNEIQGNKNNAEHFRKLETIVKTHAESPPSLVVNGRQTIVASIDDAIELVAHPSRAPVSTDPGYILCAQLEASAGSVHVYGLVANLVHSSGLVGAVVLCGGVKGLSRIVFKTLTKYSGDFAQCRDLVRCTVQVDDMRGVATVLELILRSKDFVVVRIKNRLAKSYNSRPIGGYRDVQLLVIYRSATEERRFAEVQINLARFVELKGRKNGGHEIFNFARALMAYDPTVYNYSGECTREACDKAAAGLLIGLKVAGGCKADEQAESLARALSKPTCRVEELDISDNKFNWTKLEPVVIVRLAHLTELKYASSTPTFLCLFFNFTLCHFIRSVYLK